MSEPRPPPQLDEQRVENAIGLLLRAGVLLAALIVICGGALYLGHHGAGVPEYQRFHGEPSPLRRVSGVFAELAHGSGRGVIQLGLLVLIATPVLRVAFAALAFSRQRDWLYTAISLLVLAVLAYAMLVAD